MKNLILLVSTAIFLFSCSNLGSSENHPSKVEPKSTSVKTDSSQVSSKVADAATIMSRKQVPILCYHHIRDIPVISKSSSGYDVTLQQFKDQMKTLADSGYQTITPDQLYSYLAFGTGLPEKPVMLTYDDTDEEQFTYAKTEMDKYGFKGVYFIMTISMGRPRYMTKDQIKQLSDEGHVIACHTWDHNRVDKYIAEDHFITVGNKQKRVGNDWDIQLLKPKQKLEELTGKQIDYFAYPFGIWSQAGIPEIKNRGFKMAFQLSAKRDSLEPLYTVRRMIVSPQWSATGLIKTMKSTFR